MIINNINPKQDFFPNFCNQIKTDQFEFIIPSKKNNNLCDKNLNQLKTKFSDEEFLKKLYDPNKIKNPEDKKIQKLLSNPFVAQELLKDESVMKASTKALLEITQEQLKNAIKNKEQNQIEDLSLIFGVLSLSLESLEKQNCNKLKINNNRDKNLKVAFAGLLNFGILDDATTKKEKAEIIINRYATGAAATGGLLANSGIGDTIALTILTKQMCKKIFKTYNMPTGGYVAAVTSVAAGAVIGSSLSSKVLTLYPGVGNFANATITYALHQLTGRACVMFCEEVGPDAELSDADAVAKMGVKLKLGLNIIQNDTIRELAKKAIVKAIDLAI